MNAPLVISSKIAVAPKERLDWIATPAGNSVGIKVSLHESDRLALGRAVDNFIEAATSLDWQTARARVMQAEDACKRVFDKPQEAFYYRYVLAPLIERYNGGERSLDLYEKMQAVDY